MWEWIAILAILPPHLSKWQWAIVGLFMLLGMNSWSYGQYIGMTDSLSLDKPMDPAPNLPAFANMNTCNYVEFGTFDNLNNNFPESELEILFNFDIKLPQFANGGSNTPDPYWGNDFPEQQPGGASSPFHPSIPNCKPANTALQVKPANQSRYIGLAVQYGTIEGIYLPLNRSLVNGMKYNVSARVRLYSATCPTNHLNFQFSENVPCPKLGPTSNQLNFPSVPNANGNGGCNLNHLNPNFGQIQVSSHVWQTISFDFVASGSNMDNLIIYQDYHPNNPATYAFIDDVEVVEVPELQLNCQTDCKGNVSANITGVLPNVSSYEWTLTGPNQTITSTTTTPNINILHPEASQSNISITVNLNPSCPIALYCTTQIPPVAPTIDQMNATYDICCQCDRDCFRL